MTAITAAASKPKRAFSMACILRSGVERRWLVEFSDGRVAMTVWKATTNNRTDRAFVLRNAIYGVNAR